jgi:hypothetical protein
MANGCYSGNGTTRMDFDRSSPYGLDRPKWVLAGVAWIIGMITVVAPMLIANGWFDTPARSGSVVEVKKSVDNLETDARSTVQRVQSLELNYADIDKRVAVIDESIRRFEKSAGEAFAVLNSNVANVSVAIMANGLKTKIPLPRIEVKKSWRTTVGNTVNK